MNVGVTMNFTEELGIDPERLVADADRFFGRLGRLPGEAATARAESGDGWVSVEYLRAATGALQENLERAGATIDRVRALLRP
ncbi:hypothetical protein [Nonomuraea sp. NPDC052265]|uniref:hypothetical protein n=1 Tax=Nonomuraea sp. NPDC052265 TaxID=3364374 RepID=UPI0037CB2C77